MACFHTENFLLTIHKISLHFLPLFSLPRDNIGKFSSCHVYNRDYKKLANLFNNNENLINDNVFIENVNVEVEIKSPRIINCQHGWRYDTTMFPSTVVSEV